VDARIAIGPDDPRRDDVRALVALHRAFGLAHSPPEDVHALELDGLLHPSITFLTARRDGVLVAMGALRELDASHGELKSMHTVATVRRQGIATAMLTALLDVARARGYRRVSLETGSMEAFAPAVALYVAFGFEPCAPFAAYRPSPSSRFLTLELEPPVAGEISR
jgi:putative acetyltransferase